VEIIFAALFGYSRKIGQKLQNPLTSIISEIISLLCNYSKQIVLD